MKKRKQALRYIMASLFTIAGIGMATEYAASGILIALFGILLAPAPWRLLDNKGIRFKKGMRSAVPIALFCAAALAMPQAANDHGAALSGEGSWGSMDNIHAASDATGQAAFEDDDGRQESADEMEVHFIDVGQGDATLIKSGGSAMLIDAGDDTKGTAIQNYLNKQGITKLDYLVLTHPDSDHIGGAPVIIGKFEIEKVFLSNYEKDNKTYRKLIQALDDKRLAWSVPEAGSSYPLGSASLTMLTPIKEYGDPNNASLALIVQNGLNRFLFTGDAEEEAENDLVESGLDLQADVYHAGHHGSRTSSSIPFLRKVNPAYAVISCAEDNAYGHPHAQTLNRLRERGVKVLRTDEQGSIVAVSDGNEIKWSCAPSDTWKAGEPTGSAAVRSGPEEDAPGEPVPEQDTIEEPIGEQDAEMPGLPQSVEESAQTPEYVAELQIQQDNKELTYVLNIRTKKFHRSSCNSLPTTNRSDSYLSRDEIIAQGYVPCKKCNP